MNKSFVLVWAFFAFAGVSASGQTAKAFEKAAEKSVENKDYYSALRYLENALSIEGEKADLLFKHAEAARFFEAYGLAELSYEKALALEASSGRFDLAWVDLAECERRMGKYEEAAQHFDLFLQKNRGKADPKLIEKAEKGIEDSNWALGQKDLSDASVSILRLGDDVNTELSDFGASRRGDTLFFSSFKNVDWKDKDNACCAPRPLIRTMQKIGEGMPEEVAINAQAKHSANLAISPGGEFMVYSECSYTGVTDIRCDLVMRKRLDDGTWSEPQTLPSTINEAGSTTTQPSIAVDYEKGQTTLFFVSDRAGGQGKLDIWASNLMPDGQFSAPQNLAGLNTEDNDITPFFDRKAQFLYFSSDGRRSMGGYDIFRAKKNTAIGGPSSDDPEQGWEEPENVGQPFNSPANDIYYVSTADGDTMLFASNRKGSTPFEGENCCYDIYEAKLLPIRLEALVFEKIGQAPINDVVLRLVEITETTGIAKATGPDSNRGEFDLKRTKSYWVIASKEGFEPDSVKISTDIVPTDRIFREKLFLEKDRKREIEALTYNAITGEPLDETKIRVVAKDGNEFFNTGKGRNQADITARGDEKFMVIGERDGFLSDTAYVTADELKNLKKVSKKLNLTPGSLSKYLPISLYFDNDQPDPRTRTTTTQTTYDETYGKYIVRKDEFIDLFSRDLSGEQKIKAQTELADFFDQEVKIGMDRLERFSKVLSKYLDNGFKVDIIIKGYASPLATSDYNQRLTLRRSSCVLNFFKKTSGGIYSKYIADGRLTISTVGLGETTAKAGINDSGKARRLSVFSPEASRERRAEILEINLQRQ